MNNEQQLITITGNPNGGSFLLGFKEVWGNPLPFNANAATMTTELCAISTVGAGNLSVVGGGQQYNVYFQGDLGNQNVPLIEVDYTGLNRGSVVVLVVTEGVGPIPPDPAFPAPMTLPVWVAPSARDLTRTYMMEQLAARGYTLPWYSAIPAVRPEKFFVIDELNSATEYGAFADAQLLQIRGYSTDLKRLGQAMRLVKGLWKVMPAEMKVQNVEHAGGPLYDEDPDVPGLRYGQIISWVTVMTELV
jgi:hypothetical protein